MQHYNVATQHEYDMSYGVMDPVESGCYVSVDDVKDVVMPLLDLIQRKLDPYLLTDEEELMIKTVSLEWSAV